MIAPSVAETMARSRKSLIGRAREQPAADEGADDADDDVADQAEAVAFDDLPASQPAIAPMISKMSSDWISIGICRTPLSASASWHRGTCRGIVQEDVPNPRLLEPLRRRPPRSPYRPIRATGPASCVHRVAQAR